MHNYRGATKDLSESMNRSRRFIVGKEIVQIDGLLARFLYVERDVFQFLQRDGVFQTDAPQYLFQVGLSTRHVARQTAGRRGCSISLPLLMLQRRRRLLLLSLRAHGGDLVVHHEHLDLLISEHLDRGYASRFRVQVVGGRGVAEGRQGPSEDAEAGVEGGAPRRGGKAGSGARQVERTEITFAAETGQSLSGRRGYRR